MRFSILIGLIALFACSKADRTTALTAIQELELPVKMATMVIDTVTRPIIEDSVTVGEKRYKVMTGAKGGQYILRVRTRDTGAGKAGTTYKYYLPKG